MLDINPYRKGAVYFAKIPSSKDTPLPLMQGYRPVVIMNAINTSYGKVLVAPITTKPNKNGVPVRLEKDYHSTILVDYTFPIFVKQLHTYLGMLSESKIKEMFYAFDIFTGRIEAPDEDVKKYFPNQSIFHVHIGLTDHCNIPITAIESPVANCCCENETDDIKSDESMITDNVIETETIDTYATSDTIENSIPDVVESSVNMSENDNTSELIATPPKPRHKKKSKMPTIDSMSKGELLWVCTADVNDVVLLLKCSKGTALRKRKLASERLEKLNKKK